jgi:hypothetical protein
MRPENIIAFRIIDGGTTNAGQIIDVNAVIVIDKRDEVAVGMESPD